MDDPGRIKGETVSSQGHHDNSSELAYWAGLATDPAAERLFAHRAETAYTQAWPDNMLVEFDSNPATFLFDTHDVAGGREARTVAAWGRVPAHVDPRNRRRHAGYPMSKALTAAGYDKGHLIARASGGGYDANIFAQAWQVNQGHSAEGRHFRRLETLAASNPDALFLARLIYNDDTAVPCEVHLLVAIPGQPVQQCLFTNTPIPRPARTRSVQRMQNGTAFHRHIQTEFVAGLLGATAEPECSIVLQHQRNGRIDLLVAPAGEERLAVVVEIKNTDWDALPDPRVRPNFRRHVRQLHKYLDTIIASIGQPDGWDSATGVLLYRTPPISARTRMIIDDGADAEGLQVVYASDTGWANSHPDDLPRRAAR